MRCKAFFCILGALLLLLASCAPDAPPAAQTARPADATSPVAAGPTAPATPTAAQATVLPPTAVPTAVSGLPLPTATAALPTQLITDSTLSALEPLRSIGVGHARAVAFSPDNTLLIAATTAGVALFDLPSLNLLRFDPREGDPYQIAASPDDKTFAVVRYVGPDQKLVTELHTVADGFIIKTLDGMSPVWSPDGTRLALEQSLDDTTQLYRNDGSTVGAVLSGTVSLFSPDNRFVAVTMPYSSVSPLTRIYATNDGASATEVAGISPAWSPDGQTLATWTDEGIKLWRMPTGEALGTLEAAPTNNAGLVSTLAWSADGTRLHEINHFDIRTWDITNGKVVESTPGAIQPSSDTDIGGPTMFSPDGEHLAVFSPPIEGQYFGVRLLRTSDNQQIYSDADSGSIAYSNDSTLAALLSIEGQVQIVDLANGTARSVALRGYTGIAFSPDGSTLATVGSETTLWDVAGGTPLRTLSTDQPYGLSGTSRVAWSPDGKRIAVENSAGGEGILFSSAIVWEPAISTVGTTVWQRDETADAPIVTAFSPANSTAASAHGVSDVTLVAGGTVTSTFTVPLTVTALALNPIGAQLAAGTSGGTITLWELVGEGGSRSLDSIEGEVTALAYSSDGALLAAHIVTSENNGRILVWRIGTPRPIFTIGADKDVARLAWTSDSQLLAAAGPRGVGFYNMRDDKEIAGINVAAEDIAIGPGRRLIAVLSGERVVMYGIK